MAWSWEGFGKAMLGGGAGMASGVKNALMLRYELVAQQMKERLAEEQFNELQRYHKGMLDVEKIRAQADLERARKDKPTTIDDQLKSQYANVPWNEVPTQVKYLFGWKPEAPKTLEQSSDEKTINSYKKLLDKKPEERTESDKEAIRAFRVALGLEPRAGTDKTEKPAQETINQFRGNMLEASQKNLNPNMKITPRQLDSLTNVAYPNLFSFQPNANDSGYQSGFIGDATGQPSVIDVMKGVGQAVDYDALYKVK